MLRDRRLQQRSKVAASPLLDHAGLAKSLATSFRQWWLHWLKQHGWPIEVKGRLEAANYLNRSAHSYRTTAQS